MNTNHPGNPSASLPDSEYGRLIAACLEGSEDAADRLTAQLTHHARITVHEFLNRDVPDADDLIQDTVMAVLEYLRRRGGFEGSLVKFTITVARNRCRNYLIWKGRHPTADTETMQAYLTDPARGPLELLAEREIHTLLRQSLDRLGAACRSLLRGLYVEEASVEEMRRRSGLTTVQAIYYRRARCLEELGTILKNRLRNCSSTEGSDQK